MFKKINTQRYRHEKLMDFLNGSGVNKNSKVLDVGCGSGWFLEKLYANWYRNLNGCDVSSRHDFNKFEFKSVDLNNELLPYDDAEFELIICSDVLEHLENPSKLIRECRRVISQNGTLIMTIPNCANILQRVNFLWFGNTKRFRPKTNEVAPHISMTPTWIFQYFIKDKFEMIRCGGDGFIIHSWLFPYVPAVPLFSYTVFMELKPIK